MLILNFSFIQRTKPVFSLFVFGVFPLPVMIIWHLDLTLNIKLFWYILIANKPVKLTVVLYGELFPLLFNYVTNIWVFILYLKSIKSYFYGIMKMFQMTRCNWCGREFLGYQSQQHQTVQSAIESSNIMLGNVSIYL